MADAAPQQTSKAKKAIGIILNVLLYVFFALCIVLLILTLTAKRDADGTVSLFGMQMRIVVSPSMEKCDQTDVSKFRIKDIPVRSVVFIEEVPEDEEKAAAWYSKLRVGDVLTFKYVYARQETITHRIIKIEQNVAGGYTIELAGDNKNSDDGALTQTIRTERTDSPNYVIGKVTGSSLVIGTVMYVLRQPVGLVCVIIIPCVIIIIWQILRIVGVFNAEKHEKEEAEKQKTDSEIEQLKKQIEQLKNAADKSGENDGTRDERSAGDEVKSESSDDTDDKALEKSKETAEAKSEQKSEETAEAEAEDRSDDKSSENAESSEENAENEKPTGERKEKDVPQELNAQKPTQKRKRAASPKKSGDENKVITPEKTEGGNDKPEKSGTDIKTKPSGRTTSGRTATKRSGRPRGM